MWICIIRIDSGISCIIHSRIINSAREKLQRCLIKIDIWWNVTICRLKFYTKCERLATRKISCSSVFIDFRSNQSWSLKFVDGINTNRFKSLIEEWYLCSVNTGSRDCSYSCRNTGSFSRCDNIKLRSNVVKLNVLSCLSTVSTNECICSERKLWFLIGVVISVSIRSIDLNVVSIDSPINRTHVMSLVNSPQTNSIQFILTSLIIGLVCNSQSVINTSLKDTNSSNTNRIISNDFFIENQISSVCSTNSDSFISKQSRCISKRDYGIINTKRCRENIDWCIWFNLGKGYLIIISIHSMIVMINTEPRSIIDISCSYIWICNINCK